MAACVLCEPFSAHKAYQMGILTDVVPALKVDGKFVANPLVATQRQFDEFGRNIYGESKTGDARRRQGADEARRRSTSPCSTRGSRTVRQDPADLPRLHHQDFEELRKPKLDAWNRNKENAAPGSR
jgi:6-oxo-cyclohex-1-ene-carbonyl-CoA hydrolase